jgi:glycosyltransferase involved in cell wall biosynthesis
MRLGVNALFIKPGRVGGAEEMVYSLVEGLNSCARRPEKILVLATAEARTRGRWPESQNVSIVTPHRAALHRSLAEPLGIHQFRAEVDVWLNTNYYTPFCVQAPQVTVIHDAQFRHMPKNFKIAKRAWLRAAHNRTCRSADGVVTISEAVADDLRQRDMDRNRLFVIPNPIDFTRFAGRSDGSPSRPMTLPDKRIILLVAAHYPHKNIKTVIQAYQLLGEHKKNTELHLVGALNRDLHGTRSAPEVVAENVLRTPGIVAHGYVSNRRLGELYEQASVLLAPSLFEGFGLPVAEALGMGLPVITSGIPAFREITGERAIHVANPLDPRDWAKAITRVLSEGTGQASCEAVEAIRRRYDPSEIGDLYLAAIEKTLGAAARGENPGGST